MARQNSALLGNSLMACSIIMPKVKHSLSNQATTSKHSLLAQRDTVSHAVGMQKKSDITERERMQIAARVREAFAECPSKVAVAEACGVTEQALTGWGKTGRVAKRHFSTLASMSGLRLEYLLYGELPKRQAQISDEQRQMLHLMERLSKSDTSVLLGVAERLASRQPQDSSMDDFRLSA